MEMTAFESEGTSDNTSNASFSEADKSELIGQCVTSIDKAYDLYKEYAYAHGFGVRLHNYRKIYGTGEIKGREIVCAKHGFKKYHGIVDKKFKKLDSRTGCKAMVFFEKKSGDNWEVTKHNLLHNHALCPHDKVHLLNAHRNVDPNVLRMLQDLVDSGIDTADAFRYLKAQAGGSPALGFTKKDAYNALGAEKLKYIDGCDAQTLMNIFAKRRENEDDFYYAFELDEEARLVSFFWRDKRMKLDYLTFGKLLIHDTTYRTNKYNLICAPFVGMNHHGMNCMFGCGFILNERVESFVWLFNQFLQSMDHIQPVTIMTDQAYSMAAAIRIVFPNAKHKLCTWHILKNSKKNIPHLTSLDGFEDLFNQVLMYCDTIDEFHFFWNRLVTKYSCADHPWIINLWNTREKWCSCFTKERFSGGILSSQRSESTNNSVSRRLDKTASLHDFYKCFCTVVCEWRSNENFEDGRCWLGFPEIAIPNLSILLRASKVYTILAFKIFQDNWMNGMACNHKLEEDDTILYSFVVWKPSSELFGHVVCFNAQSKEINCTCKQYDEVGILCCHSLKVYFVMCIEEVPDRYISYRWTRAAMKPPDDDDDDDHVNASSSRPKVSETAIVWKTTLQRLWNRLLQSSGGNLEARRICRAAYDSAKQEIESQLGPIEFEDAEFAQVSNSTSTRIRNPEGSRTPGARNIRKKSTREKISNRVKTRKRIVKEFTPQASGPVFINSTDNV